MFKYVEAKDEELIKKIYRFRYHVLCEEFEIFKKEDYPEGLEYDEYDQYSLHFAALDKDEKIASCLRLIYHSPIGYPTEKEMVFDKNMSLNSDKIGEISRLFICKKYRNMNDTKELLHLTKKNVCPRLKELGLDYTFASIEISFFRLLCMYDFPYKIIGKPQRFGGRMRVPSILSTEKLIYSNPDLCKEFKNE